MSLEDSSLTQAKLESRENLSAMANLTEASDIPNSIEEVSGKSTQWNVAVPAHPNQWYTGEAPRKKVKTALSFPNDVRVIHKTS